MKVREVVILCIQMFETLFVELKEVRDDGVKIVVPKSVSDLREKVMEEACKRRNKLGLARIEKVGKEFN